jgi:two-component system cell cycle sensor histidine kinase PleC
LASRAAKRVTSADRLKASAEEARPAASTFPITFRIAVLLAFVMLCLYTVVAADRLIRTAGPADQGARTGAELLAAHAQTALTRLEMASQPAAALLGANPDEPQDAIDQAMRYARPTAAGGAVVGAGGRVLAVAGQAPTADWLDVAAASSPTSQGVWVGAPPPGAAAKVGGANGVEVRWTYVATPVDTPRGRLVLILAADLKSLVEGQTGRLALLTGRNGVIVAASGLASTHSELAALGVAPSDIRDAVDHGGEVEATLDMDHKAKLAVAATADAELIGGVEAPSAGSRQRSQIANVFSLVAPMAIGATLMMLMLAQTRRAAHAAALRNESERKFRMAVEAARCGIWEWRLRDEQVLLSDMTGVMMGWGGGGLVSTDEFIARIAQEHQATVRSALQGALTFGALDVTFCVPRPNGGFAWLDARGQAFGEPDIQGYATLMGVALDVTEERVAEQRVLAAERRLLDAIDSVSDAFVLWDRRGRLLMCNAAFRSFFLLDPQVVQPGAKRSAVHQLLDLAIRRDASPSSSAPGTRDVEMVDGRWLQISERRTAEGGLVMTAADVTAIKRQDEARRLNEEALQQAVTRLRDSQQKLTDLAQKYQEEKMRAESANTAKSEFLANMSHELRTPLNAINGFSEIMVHEMFGPLGDRRYKEYAQDILGSGQHLLALINDILDMSKIEAGKMSLSLDWMDIGDVVDDVARLMRNRADAANLVLGTSLPPGLPEIEADYRAVKQILLNLISNAIKFTPAGGRIDLKVWSLGEETADYRLQISVCDTGIGIAQEDIGRLAKPFEQIETQHAKAQAGSGLGLALTKSLVEMHGGVFELESEPGLGTTVSFTLPVKHNSRGKVGATARAVA